MGCWLPSLLTLMKPGPAMLVSPTTPLSRASAAAMAFAVSGGLLGGLGSALSLAKSGMALLHWYSPFLGLLHTAMSGSSGALSAGYAARMAARNTSESCWRMLPGATISRAMVLLELGCCLALAARCCCLVGEVAAFGEEDGPCAEETAADVGWALAATTLLLLLLRGCCCWGSCCLLLGVALARGGTAVILRREKAGDELGLAAVLLLVLVLWVCWQARCINLGLCGSRARTLWGTRTLLSGSAATL